MDDEIRFATVTPPAPPVRQPHWTVWVTVAALAIANLAANFILSSSRSSFQAGWQNTDIPFIATRGGGRVSELQGATPWPGQSLRPN